MVLGFQRILFRMDLAEQVGLFGRPKAAEEPKRETPAEKHAERVAVRAHIAHTHGGLLHQVKEHERKAPAKVPPKKEIPAALSAMLEHPELKPIGSDLKRLRARLVGLGHAVTCGRCGGSGRYSYNQMHGDRCYGCDGRGEVPPKLDADLYKRVQAQVEAGGLDLYVAEQKRKAEVAQAAKRVRSELEAAEAAMDWRAYHYPPGRRSDDLGLFSSLSYVMHGWVTAADKIARDLETKTGTTVGKERDAAIDALVARRPRLLAMVAAVDAGFRKARDSGALAEDHRLEWELKAKQNQAERAAKGTAAVRDAQQPLKDYKAQVNDRADALVAAELGIRPDDLGAYLDGAELAVPQEDSEAMGKAVGFQPPPWPGAAPKKPPQSATFRHPQTGEVRTGAVHSSGEQGATIIDHETGEAHKVPHGHYALEASPPGSTTSPVSPPGSGAAGPGGGDPPEPQPGAGGVGDGDLIPEAPHPDSHPGLTRYPEPGKAQNVRPAPEGAGHKWEWEEGQGGKTQTVKSFDKAGLKQKADEGFQALRGVDEQLPELRAQIERDLALGANSKQARLAVAAKLVDQAHAGTGIAEVARKDVAVKGSRILVGPLDREIRCPRSSAILGHLLKQGTPEEPILGVSPEELRGYIEKHANGVTPEVLARWTATRLWAEAADRAGPPKGDGEAEIQAAAKEAGKAFGLDPAKLLDRYVDPVVVEAYRKGLTLSGTMRKAVGAPTRLTKEESRFAAFLDRVHDHDPYGLRKAPDEDEDGQQDG